MLSGELSAAERVEYDALFAKVSTPDGTDELGRPHYPHWTPRERDRVRALMRKLSPALQFAPSTEEIARLFGHRSARGEK